MLLLALTSVLDAADTPVKGDIGIGIGNCHVYQKASPGTDVVLGVSYLLNPDFARNSNVVWTYPMTGKDSVMPAAHQNENIDYFYVKDRRTEAVKLIPQPKVFSAGMSAAGTTSEKIEIESQWFEAAAGFSVVSEEAVVKYEFGFASTTTTIHDAHSSGKFIAWSNAEDAIATGQDNYEVDAYTTSMFGSDEKSNSEFIKAILSYGVASSVNNCLLL